MSNFTCAESNNQMGLKVNINQKGLKVLNVVLCVIRQTDTAVQHLTEKGRALDSAFRPTDIQRQLIA